ATKYFELDMEKNEEQWQQLKQVWWKKKPHLIVLGLSFICIFSFVIWLMQDDEKPSDSLLPAHPTQPTSHTTPAVKSFATPIKQTPAASLQNNMVAVKENETKKVSTEVQTETAKPVTKAPIVEKPKPVRKVEVKAKPIVKKKLVPVREKDILERVSYKMRRQYGGKVDVLKAHEFHGASHRYFEDLPVTKKKTFFTSFKKGGVRLYFYEAVHLKAIVIEQASVQGALFDGDRIKLEVQDEHFKWHTVLNLTKHDISKPMRIDEKSLPSSIKSVRIRLTSSSPMILGPIRLLE
ncbi:MAG: hypothetical protein Q9M18_03555, partial [Mariprofundaceae bacterium]|nr:hypothetical protein [Mariprofundaceae bacterium]